MTNDRPRYKKDPRDAAMVTALELTKAAIRMIIDGMLLDDHRADEDDRTRKFIDDALYHLIGKTDDEIFKLTLKEQRRKGWFR